MKEKINNYIDKTFNDLIPIDYLNDVYYINSKCVCIFYRSRRTGLTKISANIWSDIRKFNIVNEFKFIEKAIDHRYDINCAIDEDFIYFIRSIVNSAPYDFPYSYQVAENIYYEKYMSVYVYPWEVL